MHYIQKQANSCTTIKKSNPVSSALSHVKSAASRYSQAERSTLIETTLESKGYQSIHRIAATLQGSVWKTSSRAGSQCIIKAAEKAAHEKHIACIANKEVKIKENILKESAVLKYLTDHNPPASLAKYIDFFTDSSYYYICMEFGGQSLFDFVDKCHKFIRRGLLDLVIWRSFCALAMSQIANLIHWMHNTMNCCHLDISLENFVIDNVHIVISNDNNKILQFADDFQIKIIDFGVANVFGDDFQCISYVGKTGYKSPEVYAERHIFDARSADCWSLGVVFFMMVFGVQPFGFASRQDAAYDLIVNERKMIFVLNEWNLLHYATPNIFDLLQKIFVKEKNRINIKEIRSHPALH